MKGLIGAVCGSSAGKELSGEWLVATGESKMKRAVLESAASWRRGAGRAVRPDGAGSG